MLTSDWRIVFQRYKVRIQDWRIIRLLYFICATTQILTSEAPFLNCLVCSTNFLRDASEASWLDASSCAVDSNSFCEQNTICHFNHQHRWLKKYKLSYKYLYHSSFDITILFLSSRKHVILCLWIDTCYTLTSLTTLIILSSTFMPDNAVQRVRCKILHCSYQL